MEFTKDEVNNLLVLLDAGARAMAGQSSLAQAANVLAAADALSTKVKGLVKPDEA